MAAVMIVDADLLTQTPAAFQEYVEAYFDKRENMLNKKMVYWATLYLDLDNYQVCYKGNAPTHALNLRHFKTGLKPNQSLNDWIRKAEGKYLWTFPGGHDSDNVVHT